MHYLAFENLIKGLTAGEMLCAIDSQSNQRGSVLIISREAIVVKELSSRDLAGVRISENVMDNVRNGLGVISAYLIHE